MQGRRRATGNSGFHPKGGSTRLLYPMSTSIPGPASHQNAVCVRTAASNREAGGRPATFSSRKAVGYQRAIGARLAAGERAAID